MPKNPAYEIGLSAASAMQTATAPSTRAVETILVEGDPIPVPVHIVEAVAADGPESYR